MFSLGPRCLTWIWRHAIGALLLLFPSLPAIVASINVECNSAECESACSSTYHRKREMLVAVLSASALHHTNFSNLSSNMRSFIAFLILVISFCISAFYMVRPKGNDAVFRRVGTLLYNSKNFDFSILNKKRKIDKKRENGQKLKKREKN